MRTTSDLVETLVGDLSRAPPAWVERRLAAGLAAGAVLSAAITLGLWGPRPDFAVAVATTPLWLKFAFTGALAAAGIAAAARLARPGLRARGMARTTAAVIFVMACLAILQLARAPAGAETPLVMGSTSATCPWLIMLLAVPILAGGMWAVRAMAPTRLAHAGAALGLAAGAGGAFVYALSCDERAMPFVLVWYGIGILVPTVVGAALGPRLLRW